MKKIFSCLMLAAVVAGAMLICAPVAEAGTPYGFTVSSHSVTIDVVHTTSTIDGTISITDCLISNESAVAQELTFYKLAGTTTTITAVFVVQIPAVVGFYRPFGDMTPYNFIELKNFTVRRSDTTGTVKMYINYSK